MHHALRTLLCAAATLGLLWSANAQAVPIGVENHRGSDSQDRGHAIARLARSAPFDLSNMLRGRGDACDHSFWGCVRSRRTAPEASTNEVETRGHPSAPSGWSNSLLVRLRNHLGGIAITPVPVRPGAPRPTSPIPEPQAALVFMVGMGIVGTRIRRR